MITTINYSLIPSDELYTFNLRVLNLFAGKDLTGTGIEVFVSKHKEVSDPFAKAFERESKSPFTQKFLSDDALRDECFYAFRDYIVSCSHRNKPGWHDASLKIQEIIRKHGWSAVHFGFKAETAAITSIVSEVKSKCAGELTLLLATEPLDELDAAQQAFEATAKESIAPPQENEPTLTETRPAVTAALRSLFNIITLQYQATGNAALADYARSINDLIVQTMASVKANVTRADNKKSNDKQAPESGK
jgi:hypothetical protein